MPKKFTDPDDIAEDIVRDVGTNLVVGLPLGLGKANHIVNALYARAAADRAINLTFFSALTLEKPRPKEPAGTALHRARDRPPVRRLSRSGLCRRAACGCAAAQHQSDRVLLPGGKMAARAVRAAALHLRQLHPCRVLSPGARAQRHHPTGGEARRRWRDALQPELQHRHHAGSAARPRRGPRRVQAVRAGQFRTAVHAGRGRSCGRGIQRGARQSRDRFSAVRPAVRAGHPTPNTPSACMLRVWCAMAAAADRHRPDRRRAGAGPDRAPPRQRAVSRDHAAAFAGTGPPRRAKPARSKTASTASAKC